MVAGVPTHLAETLSGGFGGGAFGGEGANDGHDWFTRTAIDTKVWSGYDGPQLIITWTNPKQIVLQLNPPQVVGEITYDKLRILRKEGEYPKSVNDPEAITVFSAENDDGVTETAFSDSADNVNRVAGTAAPTAGRWYYYRIFTKYQEGAWTYDRFGGQSQGFDLAYDPNSFDDFVWLNLLPSYWRSKDPDTSQKLLTLFTDTTTDERVNLAESRNDIEEGFSERFLRILSLVIKRIFVYTAENHQCFDFQHVRADALRHLAYYFGGSHQLWDEWIVPASDTYRTWRSRLQDSVYQHKLKGRKDWLDIVHNQHMPGIDPMASVEMSTRVHYAWNPQEPDTIRGGLTFEPNNNGLASRKIEMSDDPNYYCWHSSVESPYNERGWRVYYNPIYDPVTFARIASSMLYGIPRSVTYELWHKKGQIFKGRVT